jgi:two-component system chemotaxis sensor kinase CheA
MEESSVDPEILIEFIDESTDNLETVSELLVQLEKDQDNLDLIQSIFRPIHSIKGNSAFFGMFKTKTLAHKLENILDLLRNEHLIVNEKIISTLLRGVDLLKELFHQMRLNGFESPKESEFECFLEKVDTLSSQILNEEEAIWKELLNFCEGKNDKICHTLRRLSSFSAAGKKVFSAPTTSPSATKQSTETISKLKNLFQSPAPCGKDIRNELELLNESQNTEAFQKEIERTRQSLELLENTLGLNDPISVETFLSHCENLENLIALPIDSEEKSREKSTSKSNGEAQILQTRKRAAEEKVPSEQNSPQNRETKTMRVSEQSIDKFLSFVGELVTIGEMYSNFQSNFAANSDIIAQQAELRRINESFHALSLSLQKSLLNIRLVSMNTAFQKFPKIVRDIAVSAQKKIELKIEGSELKVDKSIIDAIDAPLTHMIRNAADHGIEPIETRISQGKSAEGKILIQARKSGEFIEINIEDDGRGINHKELYQKALKMNLISENASLSHDEITQLIFHPGLSTAKTISEISGRGVGMDVVKKTLEQKKRSNTRGVPRGKRKPVLH